MSQIFRRTFDTMPSELKIFLKIHFDFHKTMKVLLKIE